MAEVGADVALFLDHEHGPGTALGELFRDRAEQELFEYILCCRADHYHVVILGFLKNGA